MPITAICGGCGKTVTVPDAYAGRTGKCKRCGLPVEIPTASEGDEEPILLGSTAPEPDYAPPPIQVSDDDDIPTATAYTPPPLPSAGVPMMTAEPWYYKFLVIYAHVVIIGGAVIWLLWVVFAVFLMGRVQAPMPSFDQMGPGGLSGMPQPSAGFSLIGLGALLIPPTLFLIATVTVGSLILIAVDSARNLRVIRLQGHLKG